MRPRTSPLKKALTLSIFLYAGLFLNAAVASDAPALGKKISHSEAMADSLTVYPSGQGLPAGSGDAKTGKALYQQHCAACHGSQGRDSISTALVGGTGTLTTAEPIRTVGSFWPYATTLFDYIQRAMPYNNPGSLEFDELYSITAYVLFLNTLIEEDTVLNESSLATVEMPNKNGFDWLDWTKPDT